jgi:acyl carrier protein
MELNDFVNNFVDQLDETDRSLITGQTDFRSIEEWSSFVALTIIAMVDSEYGVKISGEDIKKSNTIEDIYKIVISRIKNVQ